MSETDNHSLTKATPVATLDQIEKGYNAHILNENPLSKPEPSSGEAAIPLARVYSPWRARKRAITIVVSIIVIVGLVIGAVVGKTTAEKTHHDIPKYPRSSRSTTANSTSQSTTHAGGSEIVAILTTTLVDSDSQPITVLTLSTTVEVFQTESHTAAISTSQPLTTAVTDGDGQTTTVTAFFSTLTGRASSSIQKPSVAAPSGTVL
ncbi:hypothetical protein DL96DRAFT_492760 [Flagelloscypha sp. PMI_526]|nr:hypothetical protein DL96DRAFT_492760 [Flagelloscypha sp. PMI_526]